MKQDFCDEIARALAHIPINADSRDLAEATLAIADILEREARAVLAKSGRNARFDKQRFIALACLQAREESYDRD